MPFNPSFTTSQTIGVPESVNFADTSTGSDGSITARRVYMQLANGDYLVPDGTTTDYFVWALADVTKTFDLLTKDVAVTITVQWVDTNGTVLYSAQSVTGFTLYNETFAYQINYAMSGNPLLINDNQYFEKDSELRVNIDSGNQAISFAGDTYAAQQSYDRATAIRNNAPYVFNINK